MTDLLPIQLNAKDNPFERARKAWEVMGFRNDRLEQIGKLAEVFMAYHEFDRSTPSPEDTTEKEENDA